MTQEPEVRTPQVIITLSSGGDLIANLPGPGALMRQQTLPTATAGKRLLQMLLAQQKALTGKPAVKRAASQPNYEVIAKHLKSGIEIRRLPDGPGISQPRCHKTLEEMDL